MAGFGGIAYQMLVLPKGFPHTAPGQVAFVGLAKTFSGNKCDQADAGLAGQEFISQIHVTLPGYPAAPKQPLDRFTSAQDPGSW